MQHTADRRKAVQGYDRGVSGSSVRGVPVVPDPAVAATLRAVVQAAGLTVEQVEAELGTHELRTRSFDLAAHRRRLPAQGSFGALVRLFLLGDAVAAKELEAAVAPVGVEGLVALGLCRRDADEVRATAKLVPHGEYLLASDTEAPVGAGTPFDYVPGVQAPSVTLAKLAVRREVDAVLDLGTGLGLQALLAAKHARRVVATDINQRALSFAAFNAALNGIANVELREGNGFEPVARERFDLIVANPPYVISPERSYAYRDSGLAGDELCRRLVEAVPDYLAEGGFAHLLVSWAHQPEGEWDAPLREWVAASGCDAWLLHYRSSDPLAHAVGWLRPLAEENPALFEQTLDRWLAYLRERKIEAVGYGAVVLRRRGGGRNWIRSDRLPLERLEPASAHTLRVFAANSYLDALADESELLEQRLALIPDHRLRQTLRCHDGGAEIEEATLDLSDGLGFSVGLDRYTMLLLPQLDGSRPLAQALDATAAQLDLTPEGEAAFVPAALPAVRRLLELGFLDRADERS